MNNKYKKIIKNITQFLGIFIIVFSILYFISNYQSLSSRIKYKFAKKDINIEEIEREIIKEKDVEEIMYNDTIVIPKINVKAPIIWTEREKDSEEDLKLGVSHFPGTVEPGEIGNSVIIGHSSNYWWEEGGYNTVFANLSELENNDKIYIYFKNKKILYSVYEEQVLSPNYVQSEILKEKDEPILTLITCVPLGTNINRLLVKSRVLSDN